MTALTDRITDRAYETALDQRRDGGRMSGIGRLGAVAVVALLGLASAASAATVRKGTPYAAEVRAYVTGAVHITGNETATTFTVCTPSGNAVDARAEDYRLNWRATFPHITVPVITRQALGRAAKRLHVPITPTSSGTAAGLGGYSIHGMAPPTSGSGTETDCQQKSFATAGLFGGNGAALYDNVVAGSAYDNVHYWELQMVDPAALQGSPPSFDLPDGSSVKIGSEFSVWTNYIPPTDTQLISKPGWNYVNLRLDESRLAQLAKPGVKSVEFKSDDTSSKNCGTPADSSGSYVCSVSWTFDWTIKLTKRFLYRTVRAYVR